MENIFTNLKPTYVLDGGRAAAMGIQRWLATYLLASEKRMRRPRGHAGIPALWVQLRTITGDKQDEIIDAAESVA